MRSHPRERERALRLNDQQRDQERQDTRALRNHEANEDRALDELKRKLDHLKPVGISEREKQRQIDKDLRRTNELRRDIRKRLERQEEELKAKIRSGELNPNGNKSNNNNQQGGGGSSSNSTSLTGTHEILQKVKPWRFKGLREEKRQRLQKEAQIDEEDYEKEKQEKMKEEEEKIRLEQEMLEKKLKEEKERINRALYEDMDIGVGGELEEEEEDNNNRSRSRGGGRGGSRKQHLFELLILPVSNVNQFLF